MNILKNGMIIMALSTIAIKASAGVFFSDKLEAIPKNAEISNKKDIRQISGFIKNTKALAIGNKSEISWDIDCPDKNCYINLWFCPIGWDPAGKEQVKILSLMIGDTVYSLEKKSGSSEIIFADAQHVLVRYSTYNWRRKPGWRNSWHFLTLAIKDGGAFLSMDGMPGFQISKSTIPGNLKKISLGGSVEETAFYNLLICSGSVPRGEELRKRYRAFKKGKPDFPVNAVTVPWLEKPPVVDGDFTREKWKKAAAITGFSTVSHLHRKTNARLSPSKTTVYLGYNDNYLYMAFETPFNRTIEYHDWGTSKDRPLWAEEAYEVYIHPPFTGVPDYGMFLGNPAGNMTDLRNLQISWSGRWDWRTSVDKENGVWYAEMRVDFKNCDFPLPGKKSEWTMNIFNTNADLGWSPTPAYTDSNFFGRMVFDASAPVIRPGNPKISDDSVSIPLTINGKNSKWESCRVQLAVYAKGGVVPVFKTRKTVPCNGQEVIITTSRKGLNECLVLFTVVHDGNIVYADNFGLPAATTNGGGPAVKLLSVNDTSAANKNTGESKLQSEDRIYKQTYTPEEIGKFILSEKEWNNNKIGYSAKVPAPWTAIKVNEQAIKCHNITYCYDNTLFPADIISNGQSLFAAFPQVRVTENNNKKTSLVFVKADKLNIHRIDDTRVVVKTSAKIGNLKLSVETEYEYDGMGKTIMTFTSPETPALVDHVILEYSLLEDKSKLFHIASSTSGHPPYSDSGATPQQGMVFDCIREIVWLGDHERGFSWFCEDLKDWQLKSEDAIQVISPAKSGIRSLSIKFADRQFRVDSPWRLQFGCMATPSRPRDKNFRASIDKWNWNWFWGDGQYYPFQTNNMEKAARQIQQFRNKGVEIMPCSSLYYYGMYNFDQGRFGKVDKPGMIHPDVMLYRSLWESGGHDPTYFKLGGIPEKQTASGDWAGKKFKPKGLVHMCTNSPWNDYFIWMLHKTAEKTGLAAIYLDQPMRRCANTHHGCGYIDYQGKWRGSWKIFSMRKMLQRMYTMFMETNGKAFVQLHSSNQLMVPLLSFADSFLDGENYISGTMTIDEFYSKTLPAERLQAEHLGTQFGFTPQLLPEWTPSCSFMTIRDMLGLMWLHDSDVFPIHTSDNRYALELLKMWRSIPFEKLERVHYWQKSDLIKVYPESCKYLLYHAKGKAALLVFNWSSKPEEVQVELNLEKLGISADAAVVDAENGNSIGQPGQFNVDLNGRDFRLFLINLSL